MALVDGTTPLNAANLPHKSGTDTISGAWTFTQQIVFGQGGSPVGQAYIKAGSAGTIGLVVDSAVSPTVNIQEWKVAGALAGFFKATSSITSLTHSNRDLGNNITGPEFFVGRNANLGAEGLASGTVHFDGGSERFVWVDAAAKARIHTAAPTGSSGAPTVSDTAGIVIGDQTSWHEVKHVLGASRVDPAEALSALLATKVYDFRYKESSYLDVDDQPQVFTGLVGYDRRHDWFLKNVGRQQAPSLNEISLHGYTVLAIQALAARLAALEAR